jgi:hypothetical protein
MTERGKRVDKPFDKVGNVEKIENGFENPIASSGAPRTAETFPTESSSRSFLKSTDPVLKNSSRFTEQSFETFIAREPEDNQDFDHDASGIEDISSRPNPISNPQSLSSLPMSSARLQRLSSSRATTSNLLTKPAQILNAISLLNNNLSESTEKLVDEFREEFNKSK